MSHEEDITKIKLNSDQQNTVEQLDEFVKSNQLFFRLDGAAGTGKSTTAATWAKHAVGNGIQLALAAPTNKATRQLRLFKNRIDQNAKIPTGTIYSLLGLVLGKDGEVREIETTDTHKMDGVQAVIVDEWSMVNDNLMGKIRDHALANNTKVIFMGDPYQLPPVGQEKSAVERLHRNSFLHKVERHDNQILSFATYLRECIDTGTTPTFKTDRDEDGGVSVLNSRDFYRQLKKAFSSDVYDEVPDAFKCLAWRNAIVDEFNDSIRNAMYNDDPADPFEIGERIVAKAPVLDVVEFKISGKESFIATTDEEGTVRSCVKQPHPVFGDIEVWAVVFENELGHSVCGYLPTKEGKREYLRQKNKLYERAKTERGRWPAFWQFIGMFADLAPCHALTTHRGQGSTYRTAFVDVNDIMVNRNTQERLRMLYTAATRPSKSLILKV